MSDTWTFNWKKKNKNRQQPSKVDAAAMIFQEIAIWVYIW
jgi:hypothetical protein